MVEKSGLGSTIGSRSGSPKPEPKNFIEMNRGNIKKYTKKAGSENGDHKGNKAHGTADHDEISLTNSHFSIPAPGKGLDFIKQPIGFGGNVQSPIKMRLDHNLKDAEFLGQGGTLPTPASGHGMKKRGETQQSPRLEGNQETSPSGRGLGRSQSPTDPRLKQVVNSLMAEVSRSIEAHKIQAERREALRQQK